MPIYKWPDTKEYSDRLTNSVQMDEGEDSNMASNWIFHLSICWSDDKRLFGLQVLKFIDPEDHVVYDDDGEVVSDYEDDPDCRSEYLEVVYLDPPSTDPQFVYQELLKASDEFDYLAE